MKIIVLRFLLLALVSQCHAQQTPAQNIATEIESWLEPTEPAHIVGPIYYVGTRGIGIYLFTTPAGHILLDGGMPGSAPLVAASVRKLGFKPEDIRVLIVSHSHYDHVGGLAALKKISGASVAAMTGDEDLLKSGGKTDYLFANDKTCHFEPVTADRILKDGDIVTLGGLSLTARHTPGHTRGCTTWITTVEEGGRSYLVVFPGSTTVNPGTRLVHDPSYPGIADDYRRSLDLLDSLKPDIHLAAHASFFDFHAKRARAAAEGVKVWVDPEGYRERLDTQRAKIEALIARESATPPKP